MQVFVAAFFLGFFPSESLLFIKSGQDCPPRQGFSSLRSFDAPKYGLAKQITVISLRIFVWYAKSTHRTICRLCGVVGVVRPPGTTVRPSDDEAESSSPVGLNPYWPNTFEVDTEGTQGPENGGVLPWEPLVPRLMQEAQRLAAEGKERPLTSAVILAAVLPFSGVAVFFGAPVLAGDAALQWGASTAVGRTIGQGTKNAVEVRAQGRLCADVTAYVRIGVTWELAVGTSIIRSLVFLILVEIRVKSSFAQYTFISAFLDFRKDCATCTCPCYPRARVCCVVRGWSVAGVFIC